MARVAVVGVGAIGGVVAALLQTAGHHEITLCTRRPLESLTVKALEGDTVVQARNVTDPPLAKPVDWILIATKAYDAEGAAAWFQTLSNGKARVAVLQNGVEHRERFAAYVPAEWIVPVIVNCPVERQSDGIVLQRGTMQMKVEDNPGGKAFAQLFAGTQAEIERTDDFLTAAWQKLCLNAAGAIPALTLQPAGVLRGDALGKVALDIVTECVAVGRAEGARLEDGMAQQVLDIYRAQPPDSINSLLADRIAGRPMEIDARNGVIVRKGEKHGIGTPANRMAMALLQTFWSNATSSGSSVSTGTT